MNGLLYHGVPFLVVLHKHLKRTKRYPKISSELLWVRELGRSDFGLVLYVPFAIISQSLLYKFQFSSAYKDSLDF